jgi:fermentation-respiration switch protein FrsA (DUF1100 family)
MGWWIAVIVVAAVLVGAALYFYQVGIARTRKEFLASSPDLEQNINWDETPGRKWVEAQSFEEVEIVSPDGLKLRGYYLPARQPNAKTALLAHGYTSRAKDMGEFALFFNECLGYNVLMPDDRGHGQSEGNYIGFGWPDRKDYLLWIDWLLRRVGPQAEIVVMGVSMGGATVLMLSGEALPANIKAIVADCAYTSARDILSYQLGRMYHLPAFPLIPLTSLITKIRAGYFLGEASALRQVAKTRTPILFIHGERDAFVPVQMVHPLHAACPAPKSLWIAPNSGHGSSHADHPAEYERRVADFIQQFHSQTV